MCGIFGQATNNPNKINASNIKILGMANESRGRNSCGITYDGEIYHGSDEFKLFTDFAKGKTFKAKKYPVMFGHTRQASTGTIISDYNIHPFGFGKHDGGFRFIGVHNGTLLNHDELAKQYEIARFPEYTLPSGNISYRTKIDSEILLEILHKENNFKVLSEYNGRAALVWTNTETPNTVYLFSGKSVPDEGDDQSKAVEERPMNVWIENKNSFYFSSLEEPLYIIGGSKESVFQIDYNTLYVVKNGDFKSAEKILVSRRNNYHEKKSYYHQSSQNSHVGYINNSVTNAYNLNLRGKVLKMEFDEHNVNVLSRPIHILDDLPLKNRIKRKDNVYTQSFRYYRNGHFLEGIFMYVPNHGLVYLGKTEAEQYDFLNRNVNLKFNYDKGIFDIFNLLIKDNNINPVFSTVPDGLSMCYYFVKGVRMLTRGDYFIMSDYVKKNVTSMLTPEKLSFVSPDPVTSMIKGSVDNQNIYKNGVLFTGKYSGLYSDKTYYVRNGNLIKTKAHINEIELPVEKKEPTHSPKLLNSLIADLAKFETDYIKQKAEDDFKKEKKNNKEVESKDAINEYISEVTVETFEEIDTLLDDLKNSINEYKHYPHYLDVKTAINDMEIIIADFIRTTKIK